MAMECFTWTTELLGSLFPAIWKGEEEITETFERLPDCLIIDILSRLPTYSLLRCRWVCRHWRALVSSHDYFITLYDDLSRASRPLILLQDYLTIKHGQDLYVVGENLNNKKKVAFKQLYLRPELMINKYWDHQLVLTYSCQGVLLFGDLKWQSTYYAFNPITQEEVAVQHTLHPGYLCALYFCPYTRQFRLLYAQVRGSCCQYFVYIFRKWTWRKIRSSSSFNFLSSGDTPAVVSGALHWIMDHDLEKKDIPPCANGIMVFRMDKEELSTIPHPGSMCNSKRRHRTMTLLVKDDSLCFCNLLISNYVVDIWILKVYEMRIWIKRYNIDLCDERIFPFSLYFMEISSLTSDICGRIKLLNIQEGELLLHLLGQGLFLYNLDHRTVKRIELPPRQSGWGLWYTPMPYMKSFLAIA
ncbi:F-box protein At3g07870-like [Nicotiana tabacum]|uniref:F-box protein At3g07870-like n=1 Tax=Nicotiana tabacum TaxID=4097 RepID=UPI003F4E54A6